MDTLVRIRKALQFAGLGLVIILQSCQQAPDEFVRDNPLDPGGDDFVPPVTTLVSVPLDTLKTTSFRFSWIGSSDLLEFAYRLDDQAFSVWTSDTAATLEYLDEGDHQFEVKSQYPTGIEEDTPAQANFIVDAVPPGSLILYPYRLEADAGDTIMVELRAEEITGLTVIDCTLEYDTNAVAPISATVGSFLSKDGGTLIFIEELNPSWDVNLGVAQGPGEGVQGSGTLISFRFIGLESTNGNIVLKNVDGRGPNDESIEIASVRGCVIETRGED